MGWGRRRRRGDRGDEAGQATVELALVLPLVALLGLVGVQLGVVAKDLVLVHHAAREGARAAAVEPAVAVARAAVVGSSSLDATRLEVGLSGGTTRGSSVTVTVRYRAATDVPLVGLLIPDVGLEANVSMRVE